MPIYGQECLKCHAQFNDIRGIGLCDEQPSCPRCGGPTDRDYSGGATQCRGEQVSDAMGIDPSQIPEAVARFPHHRYNRRGQMLFKTNSEFQRALKDLGFVDKNRY